MVNPEPMQSLEAPLPAVREDLPEEELRWCSVSLSEVMSRGKRLEASVFDIEGKHAREVLKSSKWSLKTLTGDKGFAQAYHRPRFKRIWVENSEYPIYQPSQITELNPKPSGYLSPITKTNIDALRVKKGQILLTCSGTIGNCTIVNETLADKIFSHDVIRISCKEESDIGFLYAFLRTKTGNALIRTNEYGAVISHIEPEHLSNVPVPNPPIIFKKWINDLVMESFKLRDQSNDLLDEATSLLFKSLNLPPLSSLRPQYFDHSNDFRNYSVKLSHLNNRLDASYHLPLTDTIIEYLTSSETNITVISDPCVSKDIILPGRFARVYVKEGQGVPFIGGKQIFELDPSNKKYLSLTHHKKRIKEQLTLEENMILITCSGTIGKVTLVPSHWEGWTANQHIIRILPSSENIAGFLYVFLASEYGKELIKRFTYGAVVDEIDGVHVSQIVFPLLKDKKQQHKINQLALDANHKRADAYYAEQKAIRIMNDKVIHAYS